MKSTAEGARAPFLPFLRGIKMELDITGITRKSPVRDLANNAPTTETDTAQQAKQVAKNLAKVAEKSKIDYNTEQYLKDILNITQFFNKKLRFSVNKELDQVVVKVIDGQTDKVIKEIPPEVLQRLHVRIREAIGLLIDEMI